MKYLTLISLFLSLLIVSIQAQEAEEAKEGEEGEAECDPEEDEDCAVEPVDDREFYVPPEGSTLGREC